MRRAPFGHQPSNELSSPLVLTRVVFLPQALCEVERGILAALERNYAEVLLPVSAGATPKMAKYVNKLRRKQQPLYVVPQQVRARAHHRSRIRTRIRSRAIPCALRLRAHEVKFVPTNRVKSRMQK